MVAADFNRRCHTNASNLKSCSSAMPNQHWITLHRPLHEVGEDAAEPAKFFALVIFLFSRSGRSVG